MLNRIDFLRKDEPWPGYDELTVDEIRKTLARADAKQSREVREYELRHKERPGSCRQLSSWPANSNG